MLKPERIPWKESNLALIGSDLDHKVKEAAAKGEPQWDGIGQKAETKVWRIEQFIVKPWPEEKYGSFHTGDSYIVLNTYEVEDALKHDVHIWIGKESSQDEYGTAAYKMVECDDSLGGAPIQHREVQGSESAMFKGYFGTLKYLDGGVDTGFNHVEPTEEKPAMFKIKGTERGMSLTQIAVTKDSLNEGDSFVLFATPAKVWLWNGKSANPDEKSRANTLAENMCTEGTAIVLDQGDGDEEDAVFWGYLGEGEIKPADEGDRSVEAFAPLLFKLSPNEDAVQVAKGEKVKIGFAPAQCRLPKDKLDEDDVFLLDAGWEIFVWVGKGADRSERLAALSLADKYCKEDPRTSDLPLTFIKSGYEPSNFNEFFV